MTARISISEVSGELINGMMSISGYLKRSGLDEKMMELINYRVSQINGCGWCLDMHHKEAIHKGETELRLHSLAAWQECPYYSDQERAALAFADSLTKESNADDEVFATLSRFFSKKEIADLTFAIALINSWNRINKAFRIPPGNYRVGQF